MSSTPPDNRVLPPTSVPPTSGPLSSGPLSEVEPHAERYPLAAGQGLPFVLVLLALLALTVGALWLDLPIARFMRDGVPVILRVIDLNKVGELLSDLLHVCENFGNGYGVAVIMICLLFLTPEQRWGIPRVLVVTYGAGILSSILKVVIARTRPRAAIEVIENATSSWADTFGVWLPNWWAGSNLQSFPSGHSATALAFALALGWLYPRGRWFFIALAVCVGLQRMESSSHYLSDVFGGAAIGWVVAMICLRNPLLCRWFQIWERKLGGPVLLPGQDSEAGEWESTAQRPGPVTGPHALRRERTSQS